MRHFGTDRRRVKSPVKSVAPGWALDPLNGRAGGRVTLDQVSIVRIACVAAETGAPMRSYWRDPDAKVRWKEVFEPPFLEEETWLARKKSAPTKPVRSIGLRSTRLTAYDRYRQRK